MRYKTVLVKQFDKFGPVEVSGDNIRKFYIIFIILIIFNTERYSNDIRPIGFKGILGIPGF